MRKLHKRILTLSSHEVLLRRKRVQHPTLPTSDDTLTSPDAPQSASTKAQNPGPTSNLTTLVTAAPTSVSYIFLNIRGLAQAKNECMNEQKR